MVPHFVVVYLVNMFGRGKWSKWCVTTLTENTIKDKAVQTKQIYISTIHAIKYFKTLVFSYCLTYFPVCLFVCVCVTNTNTTKRLNNKSVLCVLTIFYKILIVYIMRNVSSPLLFVSFFRWFDEISVVLEVGKNLAEKM